MATAALVNQGTRAVASGPIVRQGLEHAISQTPADVIDTSNTETETSDNKNLDWADLDGVARVVGRTYSPDRRATPALEAGPLAFGSLHAVVAKFDGDEQAAAAMRRIHADLEAFFATLSPFTVKVVDPAVFGFGFLADRVRLYLGQGEDNGIPFQASYVLVHDDAYVYVVFGFGYGLGPRTMEAATAVARAMFSPTGQGDEVFDASGASTGGLWDKLPAAGFEVVPGLWLAPDSDEVVYPEPDDGKP